jgi:hypothetical protein
LTPAFLFPSFTGRGGFFFFFAPKEKEEMGAGI